MAGAPSYPLVIACAKAAGASLTTFSTAQRVLNVGDVWNASGNYLQLGACFRLLLRGGLSNKASSPGTVVFQLNAGSTVLWSSGNLSFNAASRVLLPFTLDVSLRLDSEGTGTSAKFMGQGTFGGIHLTNTDQTIQVPTTAPALGSGFDSVAAAGNVIEPYVGFSLSDAANGVQIQHYELWQISKINV